MAHFSIRMDENTNRVGLFQYFTVDITSWTMLDVLDLR